jgi:ribosomal protein L37AE/L43A
MISQNCPKCNSSRIRRGYRSTSIFSKILFRYNLLCDSCNWEFTGFAVPFTVDTKPERRKIKRPEQRGAD